MNCAIDALENSLKACPAELWESSMWNDRAMDRKFSQFWYVAYHALFYLDLYLSGSVEGFMPPASFTLDELDPAGVFPERVYTKDELLSYLNFCRQKCNFVFANLTDKKAGQRCKFDWLEMSFVELQMDNMRHVQEHAAQLNMFLGQQAGIPSRWF
jgi:hypothetical protein